jgi:phosphatidylglycerol:prolipoprotein diacylglycerol transferase
VLLKIGMGMSSFGGFAGGLAGAFLYFRRLGRPWLADADILTEALVVSWIFGRLGCSLVHDHLGAATSFPLGISFRGGTFHDLGLYEFLFTLCVLVPALRLVRRRARRPGLCVATVCLLYAPVRFGLDFLRIADVRYLGLTPAQWGAMALGAYGTWLAISLALLRPSAPPAPADPGAFPVKLGQVATTVNRFATTIGIAASAPRRRRE